MSALTVTASSVLKGANASTNQGTAGATITAGQPLYIDAADSNKLKPCDADASTAAASAVGIALHGASSGQPITYVTEDYDFTPGATLVTAKIYVVGGSAAGDINPSADITTGWYPVVLFVAKSTTKAVLKIVKQVTAASA